MILNKTEKVEEFLTNFIAINFIIFCLTYFISFCILCFTIDGICEKELLKIDSNILSELKTDGNSYITSNNFLNVQVSQEKLIKENAIERFVYHKDGTYTFVYFTPRHEIVSYFFDTIKGLFICFLVIIWPLFYLFKLTSRF